MKETRTGRVAAAAIVAIVLGSGTALAGDPAANRRASANYDAVVHDNPAFRANREHAECDAIQSLDLRAQCIATFDRPAPVRPSGTAEASPSEDLLHPRVTITNGPVRNPDDD